MQNRKTWLVIQVCATAAILVTAGIFVSGAQASNSHAGHGFVPTKEQSAAIQAQAKLAPVRGSEFRANCRSSHRAGNDPIVFPGQTGASHIHEFFGNRTTNANSTVETLRAGATTCDPLADKAAY